MSIRPSSYKRKTVDTLNLETGKIEKRPFGKNRFTQKKPLATTATLAGEIAATAEGVQADILDLAYVKDPITGSHFVIPKIPKGITAKSLTIGLKIAMDYLKHLPLSYNYTPQFLQFPKYRLDFAKYSVDPWIYEWVPTPINCTFNWKDMYKGSKLEQYVGKKQWAEFCEANQFNPSQYPAGIGEILKDLFIQNYLNTEASHEFLNGMDLMAGELCKTLVALNTIYFMYREALQSYQNIKAKEKDFSLEQRLKEYETLFDRVMTKPNYFKAFSNAEAFLSKYWVDPRYFKTKGKRFRARRRANIPGRPIEPGEPLFDSSQLDPETPVI